MTSGAGLVQAAMEKVEQLEDMLKVFKAEIDIKMKIMEQILTTRNEQVTVHKNLLEREQTLYNALLSHWRNSPVLAANGQSLNFNDLSDSSDLQTHDWQYQGNHGSMSARQRLIRRSGRNFNTAQSYGDDETSDPEYEPEHDAAGSDGSDYDVSGVLGVQVKLEHLSDNGNEYEESESNADGNAAGVLEGEAAERRTRKWFSYKHITTFETSESALEAIANEKLWTARSLKMTDDGQKKYYDCKLSKKCPVKMYLLYEENNPQVKCYITDNTEHIHTPKQTGIPDSTKEEIIALFASGIRKPRPILSALREKMIPEPPTRVLISFLARHRQKLMPSIPKKIGRPRKQRPEQQQQQSESGENLGSSVTEEGDGDTTGEGSSLMTPKKKHRSKAVEYTKMSTFATEQEALDHIKSQRAWVLKSKKETCEGRKNYYNCKDFGTECQCRMYLFVEAGKTEVTLYQTLLPHNHGDKQRPGLSEELKNKLTSYFAEGITRNRNILLRLRQEGFEVKSKRQIFNWAAQHRRKLGLDTSRSRGRRNSPSDDEMESYDDDHPNPDHIPPQSDDLPLDLVPMPTFPTFPFIQQQLPHNYPFYGGQHHF